MSTEASFRAWMPAIHAGMIRSVFSFWGGEHKIMEYLVVNVNSPKKRGKHHVPVV